MKSENVIVNYKADALGIGFIKLGSIFAVLHAFSPMVTYFFRFPLSLLHVILIFAGVILYRNGRKFMPLYFTVFFLMLLAYIQYRTIWYGRVGVIGKVYGLLLVWVPCIVGMVLRDVTTLKFRKKLLNIGLGTLTFTAITTLKEFTFNPHASRELATWSDKYDIVGYQIRNVGGFEFIYSLVLVIPIVVYLMKTAKRYKWMYTSMLVIFMLCIYRSQYTMAIIFSAVGLILSLINPGSKKTIFGFGIGVILSFLLKGFIGDLIVSVADLIEFDFVAFRLKQLASLFKGDSMAGNHDRLDLYMKSIFAFFKNPLFGVNFFNFKYGRIGGHSFIFDTMGASGLIGLGMYLIMFIGFVKRVFAGVKKFKSYNYIFLGFFLFIILSLVNPTGFIKIYAVIFILYLCAMNNEEGASKNENIMDN